MDLSGTGLSKNLTDGSHSSFSTNHSNATILMLNVHDTIALWFFIDVMTKRWSMSSRLMQ